MIFPVLSHFNNQYGPKVFLKAPELGNSINLDHITSLMDLYREGFFVYECGALRTANLFFEIPSPRARGHMELLMISLVCFDSKYNLNSFQEIMEFFVSELKHVPDIYKGFYYSSKKFPDAKKKFKAILNFFYSLNRSLPKDREIIQQNTFKILTYGLSQTGIKNIIKSLQEDLLHFKNLSEQPPLLRNI